MGCLLCDENCANSFAILKTKRGIKCYEKNFWQASAPSNQYVRYVR